MADKSFLDWPFLEPRHKELALALDDWATKHVVGIDHHDADAACRDLVRKLGEAGWLNHTAAADGECLMSVACV